METAIGTFGPYFFRYQAASVFCTSVCTVLLKACSSTEETLKKIYELWKIFISMKLNIHNVSSEAKGSNWVLFKYIDRPFCLPADDNMYMLVVLKGTYGLQCHPTPTLS